MDRRDFQECLHSISRSALPETSCDMVRALHGIQKQKEILVVASFAFCPALLALEIRYTEHAFPGQTYNTIVGTTGFSGNGKATPSAEPISSRRLLSIGHSSDEGYWGAVWSAGNNGSNSVGLQGLFVSWCRLVDKSISGRSWKERALSLRSHDNAHQQQLKFVTKA